MTRIDPARRPAPTGRRRSTSLVEGATRRARHRRRLRSAAGSPTAPPARRPARPPPAVPEGLDRVGAVLDVAVASGRVPGIVAMVGRGGATLGQWVTGQADAIRGRPMRADPVFDLASLTKVVATTTVTLALASRAQLGLGDPVAELPAGFRRLPGRSRHDRAPADPHRRLAGKPQIPPLVRLTRGTAPRPLPDPACRAARIQGRLLRLGSWPSATGAAVVAEPLNAAVGRRCRTTRAGLHRFDANGPPDRVAATERREDHTAWTGTVLTRTPRPDAPRRRRTASPGSSHPSRMDPARFDRLVGRRHGP